MQLARPAAIRDIHRIHITQMLLGIAGNLQQFTLLARLEIVGHTGTLENPVRYGMVEIITTQSSVAASGQYLENSLGQAKNRNIEGTAAQIVDRDNTFGLTIQTIGDGGRGRLVEQAQHAEPGKSRGVLGSLTLGIVEIGRNGNHRTDQLATQSRLGTLTECAQDLSRDFNGALGTLNGLDERHLRLSLTEAVRQLFAQLLHIGQPATHQPLDRTDGVERIGGRGKFGLCANLNAVSVIAHHRRQDHLPISIGQRRSDTTAQGSYEGVGGPQVYSDSQAPLMGLGGLSGLGNLK